MRRATLVLVSVVLAFVASSAAGPHKVLVLPLDGNAPAAQRSKLNAAVVKLVKKNVTGDVTVGDTTFAETAAAVGCDPHSAACAQTVLTTLAVDEIVYGAATKDGRSTKIVVHRVQKGSEPHATETTIAASEGADKAEPGLEAAFVESKPPEPKPPEPKKPEPKPPEPVPPTGSDSGSAEVEGSGSGSAIVADEPPKEQPTPTNKALAFFDTKERIMGVAFGGAGVVALVVGVSFWIGKLDVQNQIDEHATNTLADFQALATLEDEAGSKALWGNVFVGLGLVLGGASAYMFYKDSESRSAAVTAQPTETGTGAVISYGGRW